MTISSLSILLSTVLGAVLALGLMTPPVQDRPASEEPVPAPGTTPAVSPAVVQEAPVPERPAGNRDDPPETRITLELPGGSREVSLTWRQVGRDLKPFLESPGLDEAGLHQLRVLARLRFGGRLKVDAPFTIGKRPFSPGSYPLGFTVSAGEALRFFLVDGNEAVPLGAEGWDPAWSSPVMLFQLAAVDRGEVRLLYHHGNRAGVFALRLGAPRQDR